MKHTVWRMQSITMQYLSIVTNINVSDGKKILLQCRRPGFNLGVRKIPWRWGNGYPLQCSCLENFTDRILECYSPWGRRVRHSRVTNTFTSFITVNILKFIDIENHCAMHQELKQCCKSIILKKKNQTHRKRDKISGYQRQGWRVQTSSSKRSTKDICTT